VISFDTNILVYAAADNAAGAAFVEGWAAAMLVEASGVTYSIPT